MTTLRKNQSEMVRYFELFNLSSDHTFRRSMSDGSKKFTIEELMTNFNPEDDMIDQKLLYFLTGRERKGCMGDWIDAEPDETRLDGPYEYGLEVEFIDKPLLIANTRINEEEN